LAASLDVSVMGYGSTPDYEKKKLYMSSTFRGVISQCYDIAETKF
jgi:hypothetical protein